MNDRLDNPYSVFTKSFVWDFLYVIFGSILQSSIDGSRWYTLLPLKHREVLLASRMVVFINEAIPVLQIYFNTRRETTLFFEVS